MSPWENLPDSSFRMIEQNLPGSGIRIKKIGYQPTG